MVRVMSMTMLTILQIIGVSAAYFAMTLFLPWLLLRRKLVKFRRPARFMAYFMVGNFFYINLVFLLQLLHISNRATLIVGTLVPFLLVAVKHRKRLLKLVERGTDSMGDLSEGKRMGFKTLMLRAGKRMRKYSAGWLGRWFAPRWLDVLLAMGVVVLVLVMYGTNTVNVYGYGASDLPVHNYWINSMDHNHIFVAGVYPFGFHCVLYYLHEVFGISTYVLLRVFSVMQNLMIHLMLLAFLKLVCKSKYAPYVGVGAYLTTGIFYQYAYFRYHVGLPQEYGMAFILPSAYFAIAFLKDKGFASPAKKRVWSEQSAKYSLILFSIGISITLAIHFYDTIVLGLLCVAIGIGFCFKCVHWRYLRKLLLAGVGGLLIGVLPMAIACMFGTPLQGSLLWGMNSVSPAPGPGTAVSEGLFTKLGHIVGMMQEYVTNDSLAAAIFMLSSIGVLLALGILCYILRRPKYAGILTSIAVFMVVLCVMQAAQKMGLPSLLEVSRYSMYIGYGLAVVWGLCIDAGAYLLFRKQRSIDFAGLAGLALACVAVGLTGVRTPVCLSAYEPNEAIICLTNILRENKGNTSWTICSANDERQMIWERGYHYETITFLRDQAELTEDTSLTIPTDTVYFFIEKKPILYLGSINTIRPERKVSEEGAQQPLPKGGGLEVYEEKARWVTMSHMYYWAQAFHKMYPNEMEVYYETEDFVCYRVRQDGYNLYNFAIDYGYNA